MDDRKFLLHASARMKVRWGFYSPGQSQGVHRHHRPSISLLVAGLVEEEVGNSARTSPPYSLLVKPPGISHSDRYGNEGVILLSIEVIDPSLWSAALPCPEWCWRPMSPQAHHALVSRFRTGIASEIEDAAEDLLGVANRETTLAGTPPEWLRRVAEELRDTPRMSLNEVARHASVHRVYLTRAFRRWYGMSPSEFRKRQMSNHAIGGVLYASETAAAAAHSAGFADQSHMARATKSNTGHSLSHIRRLLASAQKGLATVA